jgi:hypothetical protein
MVTTDVETNDENEAFSMAINKVRCAVGDDQDGAVDLWVTGICRDMDGDYMAWEQAE